MHTERLFRVHLYYWWALDFHEESRVGEAVIVSILLKQCSLVLDGVGLSIQIVFVAESAI